MKRTLSLPSNVALACGAFVAAALSISAQTIPNPSFETDTFTVFPGYISGNAPDSGITGWTANNINRVGLNPAGGSPFANNGTIPDGANVAFIQSGTTGGTTLSTTISDLTPGQTYKVTFRCNARFDQRPLLDVEINGSVIIHSTVGPVGGTLPYKYFAFDFTASAATANLTLRNNAGGDNTVCVDDFHIAPNTSGWSYAAWSSDATSGVDGSKTYTHAYNFGRSGAGTTINGIAFTGRAGAKPSVGGSFSTTGLPNVLPFDDVNNVTGNSHVMATDFVYGGDGNNVVETLTINGLLPGGEYTATIYSVAWDTPPGFRPATFSVGNDRLTVDQDNFDNDNGIRVSYHFIAPSASLTLTYEPLRDATFHTYGFSVVRLALPTLPTITKQPRSQCIAIGQPATFTVAAEGSAPLSYKWRKDGVEISGATGSSYTIPSFAASDAGAYSVVVSNPSGSATSSDAILQVGLLVVNPSFEADNFTVWPYYVSGNGPITGWSALGGHGINTSAGPFADNGAIPDQNQVAFMQEDGALSQSIGGFTIGVDYYVVYYENARSGGVPSIEVQISGTTIVPAHPRAPVGGGNPYVKGISEAFAATDNALLLSFIKSNPQGGDTTALIDNVCILELPAGTAPTVLENPQPQLRQVGQSVSFISWALGSTPMTHQWLKDGTPIDGATGPTYTISSVTKADEGVYSLKVENSVNSATSSGALLTVYEPIQDLFNTGVDAAHAVLADGSIDPHYQLIENADLASTDAIVENSGAFPIAPHGPWLGNSAVGKWIGPRFDTTPSAPGHYVYRTTIDLTQRDPSTVIILGRWAVDNTGLDILVNGVSTGTPQSPGFTDYTSFAISNTASIHFVSGVNTIDFVTDNIGPAVGWTGLRVEIDQSNVSTPPGIPPSITAQPISRKAAEGDTVTFSVGASGSLPLSYQWKKNGADISGQTAATLRLVGVVQADSGLYSVSVANATDTVYSEPASLCVNMRRVSGVVFATGVDDTGALAANGSADLHYILAASADPDFQGPDAMVVDDTLYPISTGNWLASGPRSKWIAPKADQHVGNPEGSYTYQTFFDLSDYNPAQVRIAGQCSVDNSVVDILVNGVSTGFTTAGFAAFTPFTITSGFIPGANTLDFKMANGPSAAGAAGNPTALRVELSLLVNIQPALTISRNNDGLQISWTPTNPCQVIQYADEVTGPWTTIADATSPIFFNPSSPPARFFKVIEQ